MKQSRRNFLRAAAAAGGCLALGSNARADSAEPTPEPRYLFAVAALGGASIIDSFLPVAASESQGAATLNTFPDQLIAQPAGSNLRCVRPVDGSYGGLMFDNGYSQETFVSKHHEDMVVMTADASSVSHSTAQQRALNGDGMNGGRTIMEQIALTHGAGMALPNCNMAAARYASRGADPTIGVAAEQVSVADAKTFALATDGRRGIPGLPSHEAIAAARGFRDRLEQASPFVERFGQRNSLLRYQSLRARAAELEDADLISKLMLAPGSFPLEEFALSASPYAQTLADRFPRLDRDGFHAQAALSFLLMRYGLSCATAISPDNPTVVEQGTVINPQGAFDFSHTDHRLTQNTMWSRTLGVIDSLIDLLKSEHVGGDPDQPTMWSRSLIYVATDFGRSKERPAGAASWDSSHDLNNGNLLISPLLNGNRVFGGVDPDTCMTYGYDRLTGEADAGSNMTGRDIYSAVCQALGADFPGRVDMSAVVRG